MRSIQRCVLCQVARALAVFVLPAGGYQAGDLPCGDSPYQCAKYYISHQQFDRAVLTLGEFLQISPNDLKALNLLGIALTGAGHLEDADREFQRAINLNPHFDPALKNLAINEYHLKQTAQARLHLEQVLRDAPADESAHFFVAEILFDEKQYSAASRHYAKARSFVAKDPQAALRAAQSALEGKDRKQALDLLSLLPAKDGDAHFQAGVMLVEHQAFDLAAVEFGKARSSCKDPYLAGYDQTLAYVNAGDYLAAIRAANELLNQGYQTADLANLAASAYLKNGQAKEAYNALRLATHLDPKNEDSYVDLCSICLDNENFDAGLEVANIGLSHLPNSERLYLQRGVMHAMKGQFPEAEADFGTAHKIAPREVLPGVALGLVSMQTGHLDKAVEVLRAGASEHAENYLVQYWLARVLLNSGAIPGSAEGGEMLAALQASVRLNPDYWHSRVDLGKVLLERGELDAAITQLEKASVLNPNGTSPLYLLAQAYRRKGDEARANELVARVSKMQTEERESLPQALLKSIVRAGTSSAPASQTENQ